MKCKLLLDARGSHSTEKRGVFWICGAPAAPAVRLPCPAGRPDAVGGPYCEEHGGALRADAAARANWNYLAPACVGDVYAVQSAGCWTLQSEDTMVVVRPAGPRGRNGSDRWTVAHGVGGHLRAVPGTWDTALLAERAAIERWRAAHDTALAAIRRARGGTLDWGLPTYARETPLVVFCPTWEVGVGNTTWGPSRDPLPEALAAPLVAPRLGAHALRRAWKRQQQKEGRGS
jgi:hypothetical protein